MSRSCDCFGSWWLVRHDLEMWATCRLNAIARALHLPRFLMRRLYDAHEEYLGYGEPAVTISGPWSMHQPTTGNTGTSNATTITWLGDAK